MRNPQIFFKPWCCSSWQNQCYWHQLLNSWRNQTVCHICWLLLTIWQEYFWILNEYSFHGDRQWMAFLANLSSLNSSQCQPTTYCFWSSWNYWSCYRHPLQWDPSPGTCNVNYCSSWKTELGCCSREGCPLPFRKGMPPVYRNPQSSYTLDFI